MTSSSAPTPGELTAALRVAGVEVDGSSRARAEYSSDASLYRVVPQAVAFPRSADDVEAALSVCRSLGVSVTPRGGGTSIAGNAVGPGLVLDFSRHMTRVLALDPERQAPRSCSPASCSTSCRRRPRRTVSASDLTRRRTTAAPSAE